MVCIVSYLDGCLLLPLAWSPPGKELAIGSHKPDLGGGGSLGRCESLGHWARYWSWQPLHRGLWCPDPAAQAPGMLPVLHPFVATLHAPPLASSLFDRHSSECACIIEPRLRNSPKNREENWHFLSEFQTQVEMFNRIFMVKICFIIFSW